MKTTEAVKGKWATVYEHYELPPITGKRHYKGEAPCCGRKGKFRIDDWNGLGTFICACGAKGNGWELLKIKTGKDFRTLAREVDGIIGNNYKIERTEKKTPTYKDDIRRAKRISGTNVHEYLKERGVYEIPQKAAFNVDGNMYCIAVDENGNPVYKHVTYLEGEKKVGRKKHKLMENARFGVIRLYDMSETLGLAEGIETALAAKQIYKVNTWSAMDANNLAKVRVPRGVRRLFIFADNDKNGIGLASAFACANGNYMANNDVEEVIIRWCANCNDFNDMLMGGGDVHEWRLVK